MMSLKLMIKVIAFFLATLYKTIIIIVVKKGREQDQNPNQHLRQRYLCLQFYSNMYVFRPIHNDELF